MIRGVTIIIRLWVSRPMDVLLEQAVEVGHFVENRHAELVASFAEALDAAQQDRAAVGHADGRGHRDEREGGQLDRRAGIGVVRIVGRLVPQFARIGGGRLQALTRRVGRGGRESR